MIVRVAVCQYETELADKAENIRRSLNWLQRAADEEADLAVLPELITSGYSAGEDHLEMAEPVPGPVTDQWGEVARAAGMHIIAGMSRRDEGLSGVIYNSAVLINPEGEVVGVYDKAVPPLYLHTLYSEGETLMIQEAELFRRGNALPVFATDIARFGLQVCQDAVYGEFVRVQARRGAEIVVQVFNHPAPEEPSSDILPDVTRVHAWENGVYVVAANKCGMEVSSYRGVENEVRFQGESHIADPYGEIIARAAVDRPDLLLAELDTRQVRKAQWMSKFHRDYRSDLLWELIDEL